jgi:GTPase SAR1 family protein
MIKLYYKDAAAAIICYDVSEEKTYNSVYYWINQLKDNTNSDGGNFVMALAGNKCDLDPAQIKIPLETASTLAKEHNMILAETSAKTGKGVQELFKKIAEKIVISKMLSENN